MSVNLAIITLDDSHIHILSVTLGNYNVYRPNKCNVLSEEGNSWEFYHLMILFEFEYYESRGIYEYIRYHMTRI